MFSCFDVVFLESFYCIRIRVRRNSLILPLFEFFTGILASYTLGNLLNPEKFCQETNLLKLKVLLDSKCIQFVIFLFRSNKLKVFNF